MIHQHITPADDEPETLAAAIRYEREAAHLSVRELAKRANLDFGYVAHLEAGRKTNPSADVLQRLADALGLASSTFLPYIGVRSTTVLPSPRAYLREAYGLSDHDATEALAMLKKHFGQPKLNRRDHTKHQKGGETDENTN